MIIVPRPVLGVLLVAAALVALIAAPSGASAARRPNIVVITTDDQRQDDMIALPKTKRLLGSTGTTYRNSYVSYSLCCPSRTTFLTGQYSHNHHVTWNFPPFGGYEVFRALGQGNTLPVWLQRAGYTTGLIGKYLNEYGEQRPREIPPGWSDWQGAVDPSTYDQYGYTMNINGRLVHYGRRPRDYQTDVFAGRAVDFIRHHSSRRKPFFLWLTPNAPHTIAVKENGRREGTPAFPPPRYRHNRFSNAQIPHTPNFDEADVSDKPKIIQGFPRVAGPNLALALAHYRGRLGALLGVDDMVERVVSQLRRSGQLRNTVIVFTSDNGWLLGEHRIVGQKYFGFEESIRVPLIISGPGFPRGRTSSDPVMNVDLAPTIAAAAGARPRRAQDGYALQRVRAGSLRDRNMVVETGVNSYGLPYYSGFHTLRWHYEDITTPKTSLTAYGREDELYDLKADPFELTNVAHDPRYAGALAEIKRRLATLRTCKGRACHLVRSGPVSPS